MYLKKINVEILRNITVLSSIFSIKISKIDKNKHAMISLLFPANVRTKNDHETSVMCTDVFHKKLSTSHYYDDLIL